MVKLKAKVEDRSVGAALSLAAAVAKSRFPIRLIEALSRCDVGSGCIIVFPHVHRDRPYKSRSLITI